MNQYLQPIDLISRYTVAIPWWLWLVLAGVIVIAFPWYILAILMLWLTAELVTTAIAVRQFLKLRQPLAVSG